MIGASGESERVFFFEGGRGLSLGEMERGGGEREGEEVKVAAA